MVVPSLRIQIKEGIRKTGMQTLNKPLAVIPQHLELVNWTRGIKNHNAPSKSGRGGVFWIGDVPGAGNAKREDDDSQTLQFGGYGFPLVSRITKGGLF